MSVIPPTMSLSVNLKKRACVLDADLALSKFGLLLAQRLSDEFDVWLVREMWQRLDNSVPDLRQRGVFEQWQVARISADYAGLRFFWLGDAVRESFLPPGVDRNIHYRYEILQCALEQETVKNFADGRESHFEQSGDCASYRDTAALSAALIPYQGFILTQQGAPGDDFPESDPDICAYLRDKKIRCYKLESEHKTRIERNWIAPILGRAGISELIWAGLKLAAVHLVVPDAVIFPPMKAEEDYFDFQATRNDQNVCPRFSRNEPALQEEYGENARFLLEKKWWEGAVAFWYPL
jgi:hypothetical protein